MRAVLTLLLALSVLAAGAAAAGAATLTRSGDRVTYTAEGAEANRLTVTVAAGEIVFTDPGAPDVTASSGCTGGAGTGRCPRTGTTYVDIVLGAEDDEVTLQQVDNLVISEQGGPGRDTLRGPTGFGGNVTLVGGPARDVYALPASGSTYVSYRDEDAGLDISIDGLANDPDGENVPVAVAGVEGGAGPDTITGSGSSQYLGGLGGSDQIDGLGGLDSLNGGPGEDRLDGGDGDDFVFGEAGADEVIGGAGDDQQLNGGTGDDRLDGGPGTDALSADAGADDLHGGEGFDRYFARSTGYTSSTASDLSVTLDDAAGDGQAGENDNVHSDIEDLSAPVGASGVPPGRVIVAGSERANVIGTNNAADTIDPRGGADQVSSFAGNDTVSARDGVGDRIDCGRDTDRAVIDHLDEVANCEIVERSAAPPSPAPPAGPAPEVDASPTARFLAPATDALLGTAAPSTVTVEAGDDRGIARVVLLDDGRQVGSDDAAPYSFAYRPAGDDVGRNTLVAIAYDTSEQSASAMLPVRVDRFRPQVVATAGPARDRRAPYRFRVDGAVTPPAAMGFVEGICANGLVAIQTKAGRRTISTRRVRLARNCTFVARLVLRDRRRLGSGRLKVSARFLGTAVLAPRAARSVPVRAG